MTGKIIVHVGLPKTATTTLQQELFPRLENDTTVYLGVVQPRSINQQSEAFKAFCSAVNGLGAIEPIKALIAERLASGETLLLSEEMITVSQNGNSWRDKLRGLARLLDGLNYSLLVTVREPATALFSYYTELYPRFSKRGSFMDCALRDDDMRIYYYKTLFREMLKNFQKDRIFVIRFEDFIDDNIGKLVALIRPDYNHGGSVALGKENSRKLSGDLIVTRHGLTLVDALRFPLNKLGFTEGTFYECVKSVLKPLTRCLRTVDIHRVAVPRPSVEEMAQLRDVLRSETLWLSQHFRIMYE